MVLSIITTTWFDTAGALATPPSGGPLPAERWATDARSELGWVQLVVHDRDATLHYDPARVQPAALEAAERRLSRQGAAVASVTMVEWRGSEVSGRIVSRVDAAGSDLYAGMITG